MWLQLLKVTSSQSLMLNLWTKLCMNRGCSFSEKTSSLSTRIWKCHGLKFKVKFKFVIASHLFCSLSLPDFRLFWRLDRRRKSLGTNKNKNKTNRSTNKNKTITASTFPHTSVGTKQPRTSLPCEHIVRLTKMSPSPVSPQLSVPETIVGVTLLPPLLPCPVTLFVPESVPDVPSVLDSVPEVIDTAFGLPAVSTSTGNERHTNIYIPSFISSLLPYILIYTDS